MNNDLFIKPIDFTCVGMVTASCNYNKLCISIDDAFTFDVEPLLCTNFMNEILLNWFTILNLPPDLPLPPELQNWYDLIFGSTYIDCNEKLQRQQGVKRLWIYFSYANYIILNPFDDTPNGLKYKTAEFSMPVPIKDLNGLATTYRNKGIECYKNLKEFLCLNKEFFTNFDACDCQLSCGCEGSCSCGKTKKVSTGFRYRSIKKR